MTGGFTSEQVLNGEMNIEHEELPKNSVVDDSSLTEYPLDSTNDEIEEEMQSFINGFASR